MASYKSSESFKKEKNTFNVEMLKIYLEINISSLDFGIFVYKNDKSLFAKMLSLLKMVIQLKTILKNYWKIGLLRQKPYL